MAVMRISLTISHLHFLPTKSREKHVDSSSSMSLSTGFDSALMDLTGLWHVLQKHCRIDVLKNKGYREEGCKR